MPKEYTESTRDIMAQCSPAYAHKTQTIFEFFLGKDYDPNELKISLAESAIRDALKIMDDLQHQTGEPYDYDWLLEYTKLWLELPCDRDRLEQGYNGMVCDEDGRRYKSAN